MRDKERSGGLVAVVSVQQPREAFAIRLGHAVHKLCQTAVRVRQQLASVLQQALCLRQLKQKYEVHIKYEYIHKYRS